MPQSIGEGREYLKNLGVNGIDVMQLSATDLGVSGTPTLVLVDERGFVIESWVGKLTSALETEVMTRID